MCPIMLGNLPVGLNMEEVCLDSSYNRSMNQD